VTWWTRERVERLRALWDAGASGSECAAELGTTRNAVLGKVHRLELRIARQERRFRLKAWINLLCLASKGKGVLPDAKGIAFGLRISEQRAEKILSSLRDAGLVDEKDGVFSRITGTVASIVETFQRSECNGFGSAIRNAMKPFLKRHQNRTEQNRTEKMPLPRPPKCFTGNLPTRMPTCSGEGRRCSAKRLAA
jgi:hypothetical protein